MRQLYVPRELTVFTRQCHSIHSSTISTPAQPPHIPRPKLLDRCLLVWQRQLVTTERMKISQPNNASDVNLPDGHRGQRTLRQRKRNNWLSLICKSTRLTSRHVRSSRLLLCRRLKRVLETGYVIGVHTACAAHTWICCICCEGVDIISRMINIKQNCCIDPKIDCLLSTHHAKGGIASIAGIAGRQLRC